MSQQETELFQQKLYNAFEAINSTTALAMKRAFAAKVPLTEVLDTIADSNITTVQKKLDDLTFEHSKK